MSAEEPIEVISAIFLRGRVRLPLIWLDGRFVDRPTGLLVESKPPECDLFSHRLVNALEAARDVTLTLTPMADEHGLLGSLVKRDPSTLRERLTKLLEPYSHAPDDLADDVLNTIMKWAKGL